MRRSNPPRWSYARISRRGRQARRRAAARQGASAWSANATHEAAADAKATTPGDPIATPVNPAAATDPPAMAPCARAVGPPSATAAPGAPAVTARDGPEAARRSGLGFVGLYQEQSGGEAEQCEARVAQEAAAPESNLRELLVVDFCFEFGQLGLVYRHTRLPPLDRFLLCDLNQASLMLSGVPGFHELEQGRGSTVEMDLSGYRAALDFQGEGRAFEAQ